VAALVVSKLGLLQKMGLVLPSIVKLQLEAARAAKAALLREATAALAVVAVHMAPLQLSLVVAATRL